MSLCTKRSREKSWQVNSDVSQVKADPNGGTSAPENTDLPGYKI